MAVGVAFVGVVVVVAVELVTIDKHFVVAVVVLVVDLMSKVVGAGFVVLDCCHLQHCVFDHGHSCGS